MAINQVEPKAITSTIEVTILYPIPKASANEAGNVVIDAARAAIEASFTPIPPGAKTAKKPMTVPAVRMAVIEIYILNGNDVSA